MSNTKPISHETCKRGYAIYYAMLNMSIIQHYYIF